MLCFNVEFSWRIGWLFLLVGVVWIDLLFFWGLGGLLKFVIIG